MKLVFVGGVGSIGIAYLLHLLFGSSGLGVGVRLFAFVGVVCLAGIVDTLWRSVITSIAERRYTRAEYKPDRVTAGLMRVARINDAVLLLQLVAGSLAAWRVG